MERRSTPRSSPGGQPAPTTTLQGGDARRQAGQPVSSMPPSQPMPRRAAEEGIAGLDVFGDTPPQQQQASHPSAPSASVISTPIPLALGHITTSQPAVAVSNPQSEPGTELPSQPRDSTLTGQIRSVAPPDVARQAIRELGILAHELEVLPDRLEESGLVGIHQREYREATLAYLGLAERAWEAVAQEQLEQSGAEPRYREQAIDIARRITHMQEESRSALQNSDFHIGSRRPLFWRRRVGFVHAGLAAWVSTVSTPADPQAMGQGLAHLRGLVGLANASALELLLLGSLMIGFNIASLGLVLGLVLLQIRTILVNDAALDAALVGYLVLVAAIWLLALTLALAGRAPLRLQLGATLFTPMHSVRQTRSGSVLLAGLLRGWSGLLLLVGVVGGIVALVESFLQWRSRMPAKLPNALPADLQLAGGSLLTLLAPAGAVLVGALALVALPLLLLDQARYTADLGGNPSWVPAARRSVLRPATGVLGFLTGGLVLAVYLAATAAGLATQVRAPLLFSVPSVDGTLTAMISWRAPLLLLAIVAPYLLLVELPYQTGARRWRRRWLHDLVTRRATLESHMRRLSVRDPNSGQQDASDENLRAMQYDLILLQFYRSKIEEAENTPTSPFGLRRVLVFVVLAILLALALDNAGALIALLLDNREALLHLLP